MLVLCIVSSLDFHFVLLSCVIFYGIMSRFVQMLQISEFPVSILEV